MDSDSYDNRIEQDIAKCKQDLSNPAGAQNKQNSKSSSRVMPAFEDILKHKAEQMHPPIQSAGEKEFVRQMVEKISRSQQQDRSSEIPSLDLGGQILAQQRKIATLKRKSPGQENSAPQTGKQEIKPQPVQIQSMPPAPASPQQKIIAEIVAKEILALAGVR
jgi:hypothetical protein